MAGQLLALLVLGDQFEQGNEQCDATATGCGQQLFHDRTCGSAGGVGEDDAALRFGDQFVQEAHFRESQDALIEKFGRKLADEIAAFDCTAFWQFADPVVRHVRSHEDEVTRREAADVVTDEVLAGGLGDQLDFVLGVEVPAHGAERITVTPNLERLVLQYIDNFKIRFHANPSKNDRAATIDFPVCPS